MKRRILILLLSALIWCDFGFCFLKDTKKLTFEFVNFNVENKFLSNKNGPPVLLVRFFKSECGVQHHVLSLYKGLLERGFNINLVVTKGTGLQRRLVEEKLPHFAVISSNQMREKDNFNLFYSATYDICKKLHIKIVHVNGSIFELEVVKKVATVLKDIVVVQQYHSYRDPELKVYKGADVLLLASQKLVQVLSQREVNSGFYPEFIEFIPPLYDESKFLNFRPTMTKERFFELNFGISLGRLPVICMIANFYPCKNHKALLYALYKLIHEYKTPAHCVFAGAEGYRGLKSTKELYYKLRLNKFVHFLGFVEDIPSLLFYSDIVALPSKEDAFPITIMEAALMKKPIILSRSTGSSGSVIIDKQTGILCDPVNYDDIALGLWSMMRNYDWSSELGEAAFIHISENFSCDRILNLYMNFYEMMVARKLNSVN